MTAGAEALFHRTLCTNQDKRVTAHVSWNQYRLTNRTILLRNSRVTGGEGTRRTLTMDTYALHFAIDFIFFHLGDIVADVVNHRHALRPCLASKDPGESLAHTVHKSLAIGAAKVGPTSHSCQVGLPLVGLQRQASQLTIHQVKAEVLLLGLCQLHIVFRNLMAKTAAAAVNSHHDLANLTNTQDGCRLRIIDVVDFLHLGEVITRSKATKLLHPTTQGSVRNGSGIGSRQATMLFCDFQVFSKTVVLFDGPGKAARHDIPHLISGKIMHTCTTYTRRQVAKELIGQLISLTTYLFNQQIGRQQTHATIDIKADTTRRNNAIFGICRGHSTNRKTVSPVNIRHCQ